MQPNSVLFLSPKFSTWKGFWLCTLSTGYNFRSESLKMNCRLMFLFYPRFTSQRSKLVIPIMILDKSSWFAYPFKKNSRTGSVFCNWIYPRIGSTFDVLGSRLPQGSETTQMLFPSFLTQNFHILRTEVIVKSVENIAYLLRDCSTPTFRICVISKSGRSELWKRRS